MLTILNRTITTVLFTVFIATFSFSRSKHHGKELSALGLHVIPYPQEVLLGGQPFVFGKQLNIVLDKKPTEEDQFAASELIKALKNEFNITGAVSDNRTPGSIVLTRTNKQPETGEQGYQIQVNNEEIIISSNSAQGLFYGTQTLLQLIKKKRQGVEIAGMEINDWPDVAQRAVHYDTKHHQDKMAYVKSFIRDLARYKINMMIWEWEDKLAYPSHPEVGAPGAFTIQEMQEITGYAKKYHVQLVPLVQGLGHVSFILKWPQHQHLREIAASNWEFCPLKEDTYDLMFDLWDDAVKATPGSEYIHIGSDETYELGVCQACQEKVKEIGKSGLYLLFVNKAAKHLQKKGRKVIVWEKPMKWEYSNTPAKGIVPVKGLTFYTNDGHITIDSRHEIKAKSLGHQTFTYDPNPGIEPLFLPYYLRIRNGEKVLGSLENSYNHLTATVLSKNFDGMINTSWDDAGSHNQMWMMSFLLSAEYSWSGGKPGLEQFEESFFKNYYGNNALDMKELFMLLNEGSYYYWDSFGRKVWHHKNVEKTHLPDLPRGDAMEYDPYWNAEYAEMVGRSKEMLKKMNRAIYIAENNRILGAKNQYDLELFKSIAQLIRHTCLTYLDLSELENTIAVANKNNFIDRQIVYTNLVKAQKIIENSLERRTQVFNSLVTTWEKTRLPKGLSTKNKTYFHRQDRARHFANRRADMTYLIYDEQKLDMEGYLEKLKAYTDYYKTTIWEPKE